MPSEQYKNTFALSFSGMKALRRNPQFFWTWHHNPDRVETRSMSLGTLVHRLVLEPHREHEIAVWTGKVRNGKAWDLFEVENQGKIITKPDEYDQARRMRDSILANPYVASALRKPGKAEMEFHGIDAQFGCPVKGCFDWLGEEILLDLKKTGESIHEFETKSIWNYDYHVQMSFYLRLAEIYDGRRRSFGWVVVEDDPPYSTMMVLPQPEHLEIGKREVERMLEKFSECWTAKAWPGYDTEMKLAEIPEWILRRQG